LSAHIPELEVAQLRAWLTAPAQFALLDVREEGVFNTGHVFDAVCVPLSHLETRLPKLVPRKNTRLVLMDDGGEDLAKTAALRMQRWGYLQVSVLRDGLRGWQAAGGAVFSGVHVPGKAFGEFVEATHHTPFVQASQLQAWLDAGKDCIILDVRPWAEFHAYSVPGAINCPGVEVVQRVFDAVKNEDTTIVISCAGRTRGIIGAQSLINAGVANPVFVLQNGVQGWVLAGGLIERGNVRVAAPPGSRGLHRATQAAARVAQRCAVKTIDTQQFAEFCADEVRTLYRFDVRTPEEYAAGHLPDFRSAPGGQLVQALDHYVGVRNARIVLSDLSDDGGGVRASMSASWLLQLGWQEVYVLRGGLTRGLYLMRGEEIGEVLAPDVETADAATVDPITVMQLAACLEQNENVQILDFASSLDYQRGHIPGAWFAVRSRMRQCLQALPPCKHRVLTSADGAFARLAAGDVARAAGQKISCLQGGTRAWQAAGLAVNSGFERMATTPDDVWFSPFDAADQTAAMHAYLNWELGLMAQLEREGALPFKTITFEHGGEKYET